MTQSLASLLGTTELFSGLSAADRSAIVDNATRRHIPRGALVGREGERAEVMYLVLQGRFEVLGTGVHPMAEIGPGEPIGVVAFFSGEPHAADVRAARDSEVLAFTRPVYDTIAQNVPSISRVMLKVLGRRLARTPASALPPVRRAARTIGVCMAGATPIPHTLLEMLLERLGAESKTAIVRHRDMPSGFDPSDGAALTAWLTGREKDNDQVVMVTGEGTPPWDRAILRQCDHLLLVGAMDEARYGPVPHGALEAYGLSQFGPHNVGLVIWRERGSSAIVNTSHFLEERAVHLHHHAALDRPEDVARIARFTAGKALGAVLGGGGTLGSAHKGALRALGETGAVFDMFGGTGIGACVALEMARGKAPAAIAADIEDMLVRSRALARSGTPLQSVYDHRHFEAALRKRHGNGLIEDLPLQAFLVSANLSTNAPVLHRDGPAWQGIRAATALPAVLPPWVTAAGEILVDGGMADNLPLGPMRALKAGPNIAIALSGQSDWRLAPRPEAGTTRRGLVLRRQKPEDFPPIAEVLARSMMVTRQPGRDGPDMGGDLVLYPPAAPGGSGMRGPEQEEAAYRSTMEAISAAGGIEGFLAGKRPVEPAVKGQGSKTSGQPPSA
ncbi:cyclic nucleotide-binding and patatin-like phospholipase domain-containing protein [Pelagibacterium montanilacus]|uniref:cyclic nucleotide-binding and patatin-like phospholipase domain-containing protein n=1 Tax=Pelagibacterium montanilacus TaxID=2185280 RepID=UPI000F8E3EC5|nr:cyclic nucleotide-binding and patatin-like phospholipase domain-containing protein [Pelagibacterium montanilacus]